ncbi:MAG: redox-sensing transcriptional repressor Rex [Chloroflexi bacterium]|nr:redox-sensing transcriptional repressor Rex [Chloroflexota bacterium]
MQKPMGVPEIVVGRLPLYLRALSHLPEEVKAITSDELGNLLGISSAQIRKDLSYFGEFGKQGSGYEIDYLRQQLQQILQVDKQWPVALVGVGDLGQAILSYGGFQERGFYIDVAFDVDPQKFGKSFNDIQILPVSQMSKFIAEHELLIAIVAIPSSVAQMVADELVQAGVRAILNYAPVTLNVPEHVRVYHIDPAIGLQNMTYYL